MRFNEHSLNFSANCGKVARLKISVNASSRISRTLVVNMLLLPYPRPWAALSHMFELQSALSHTHCCPGIAALASS
eukprot:6193843-Pleurochrysis_carterae.AAC.4